MRDGLLEKVLREVESLKDQLAKSSQAIKVSEACSGLQAYVTEKAIEDPLLPNSTGVNPFTQALPGNCCFT